MCMRAMACDGYDAIKQTPDGGTIFRPTGSSNSPFIPRVADPVKEATIDWGPIVDGFSLRNTERRAGEWLEDKLGIPLIFLEMFGLGWSEGHKSFTFPMYDHERNITGVRLRHVDGSKKSIRGSKEGVFLPPFDFEDPILVTEGPTDAAALTYAGFATLGRPSCMGGVEIVAKMAHRRDIVVVSDKDSPGRRGADALARRLIVAGAKTIKVIEPTGLATDARDWVNKGATHEVIEMVIESAHDVRVTRSASGS